MKFTLSWLKEHLETDASVEEICNTLTMQGLEVEEVYNLADGLEGFVVAEVKEAEKHPDADKLRVCQVFDGETTHNVVCGAPNARAGMKAVFAKEGAYIPGLDVTLKKAKIRGVESSGMMLSMSEMNLSDDHDGIVDLPTDAKVGARAVDVMGLDETVIDIYITPNRGDCNGVRAVARDLAAAGLGKLKPMETSAVPGTFESPIKVHLDFDEATKDACPHFVGRYVKGVKNGPSPKWLQDRLTAIGLRPISALVDITNLMSIGLCRPFHAFDADKLKGDIHVRLAKDGETMLGLDGNEYALSDQMTVVADNEKPEALGGILGAETSGCSDETVNVFLECANFDPVRTAQTGRKLDIISDARYRFERGIDPSFLNDGMEVATRLVVDLCGGEVSDLVVAGEAPDWKKTIDFDLGKIKKLIGMEVPADECKRILETLGFEVEGSSTSFSVAVPPWRNDIVGEADLVEEIVRIHGYDHIPTAPVARDHLPTPAVNMEQRRRMTARRAAAALGLIEAVTYSFLSSRQADLFGGVDACLKITNPISADLDVMRPSILPNLIAAAGRNDDRSIKNAALFEIGPQFRGDEPDQQDIVVAAIRQGQTSGKNWAEPPRLVDVFDAKADLLSILEAIGAPADNMQVAADAPNWYHPGRSGTLRLGPNLIAAFGEIHPGVLKQMGVKGPVVGFELYIDNLPGAKKKKSATRPSLKLSAFQPVDRDFAFVVKKDVEAANLIKAVRTADKKLITDVRIFDVFEGGSLGDDEKSLAISVTLSPMDATLTDEQIETVAKAVVANVEKATGGVLRG